MAVNENEHLRMGAAISFAVIILAIGIPLWWKTTEVYRVPLPNDRIVTLKDFDYKISMNVSVNTLQGSSSDHVISELTSVLSDVKMFNINLLPVSLALKSKDILEIEKQTEIHPKDVGHILLIEIPEQYFGHDVIIGNHRTIYFSSDSLMSNLGRVLKSFILQDDDLKETVLSILTHRSTMQLQKRNKRQEQRVRASPHYDIIFSVISPQPEKVSINYDQESAVFRFFQPLASQLSLIAEHRLKSQWLYFVELGQQPKQDGAANHFVLTLDQLPHIISPLEKKLGSGVSKHPCLHFIIYATLCEEAPLYLRAKNGTLLSAVLSPRWGGIQLLNPDQEHCNGSKSLSPDISKFMSTFLVQLRTLLGVPDLQKSISGTIVLPLISVKLRLWELDILYRLRALEQISLAQMTLQSLSQLLEEISNIVINEEVGASVTTAVNHVAFGQQALHSGNLEEALSHARKAFESAENAFTHPSLLALLYFPDDQKYAVYIPLFIPIMIPVLLSMRSITFWKKFGTKKKE